MTLRAKLILAFLFLAAVPLVVVTVYSYASSVDALRRTVERESGAVAEQMGERMELVAADLDRRVEGLGRLPFGSLAAGDMDSESLAGDFAAQLDIVYPVLVGTTDAILVGRQFGNRSGMLPYSVLLDSDGIVRWAYLGALDKQELEIQIQALL